MKGNPTYRIAILGAGESGVGAAILAKQQGLEVFVSDKSPIKDIYKKELESLGILFEEGMHSEDKILNASEIIKSPGIPDKAPLIIKAKELEIPVISEIEFAQRYTQAKMICITGSNGKTTTTLLTHHILKNAGFKVACAGNVGVSLARLVANENPDYFVNELSSFQLDGMFDFRADIAVLLNITPDHLDRYDYNLDNYIASKFRITRNQTSKDQFIYCADDENTINYIMKNPINAEKLSFSIKDSDNHAAHLLEDKMLIKHRHDQMEMSINKLALQGKHNIYNSMAAGIVAKVLQIRNENIRESLSNFSNVEHRLEDCGKVQGIQFINDSKATNVNAAWFALESMTSKVIWIVGGTDKGNDYEMLEDMVKEKVKAIVCMGKDNSKLHKAFEHLVPTMVDTDSAMDAVRTAFYLGKKGDTVLLSPACASFDLFENYMDRGNQFKQAIKEL